MQKTGAYIFSYFLMAIFLLSLVTNWYGVLSISAFVLLLFLILYKIGKGIVLMETTAILYVFTCLVMPFVGFRYFSYTNHLSRLWVKYMPIDENVYFQFALPAIILFCFAITLPAFRGKLPDTGAIMKNKIEQIQKVLASTNKGLIIMITGVIISFVSKYLPDSIRYFGVLIYFGSFAGLLYVYFSPAFPYKSIVIILFALFIIGNAIQSGMFTIVAYMSITIFSFFQVGRKTSMLTKITLLFSAIFFFIIIQNLKDAYRIQTWKGSYKGNKLELFSTLFNNNLQKGSGLIGEQAMFPVYARTNQGFNIAVVMRRIPRVKDFDSGDRLATVLASAFVPRFLWPNKPEAGGKFNMQYYSGVNIVGWSTNVGPLGEAYGSFGPTGGIVYMFLLGLFIRWAYLKVFSLANRIPLLVCWLPVLFYQVIYSAEADTLQILNSLVKGAVFCWLIYKITPSIFGTIIQKQDWPKAPRIEYNKL